MNELLQFYWNGLLRLTQQLGVEDISLADTFQHRLLDIIAQEKHGNTPELEHELSVLIYDISELTRKAVGTSFIIFCGPTTIVSAVSETIVLPDPPFTQAQNYITAACNYVTAVHRSLQGALQLFSGDGDIWPLQCQNINHAFQKHIQPHMPENLNLSSLEGKLFFISEQVRKVQECIDNFSPYGREKSAKARKMRHELREKLMNFPQYLTTVIEHINMVGESLNTPFRCSLMTHDEENIK